MKQEVEKWRPFGHPDGDIRDLSFLDAHQAVYVQHHEGKEPLEFRVSLLGYLLSSLLHKRL